MSNASQYLLQDNQTKYEIEASLGEYENILNATILEMYSLAPIYKPMDVAGSFGQNFENLLVSIRIQNEYFSHPLLAFGHLWTLNEQAMPLQLLEVFSKFMLLSGITNGVEVTMDLETYDSADLEAVGDGLGFVIENQEDFPLIEEHGHFVEPGRFARIQIHPKLYSISIEALANFDYIDRKCVGKNEIKMEYFETYGLSNCLVSAALSVANETCHGEGDLKGLALGCVTTFAKQVGRWKIDKASNKQCLPSCER